MGTDNEALNSDWGSEILRCVSRSRNQRSHEAGHYGSSRMFVSCHDPLPDYIDPELVKLIAQNAPSELDLFLDSFYSRSRRGVDNGDVRHIAPNRDVSKPVLSSVSEYKNYELSGKSWKGLRHSCPDRLRSECEEEVEAHVKCRKYAVKRKRLTSSDRQRLPTADKQRTYEGNFFEIDKTDNTELREDCPLKVISGTSSNQERYQSEEGHPPPPVKNCPAARQLSTSGVDPGRKNAKAWRHGMRKDTEQPKEEIVPESIRCEKKALSDPRTIAEVRKYIDFKETERRKEQQHSKAEAIAARDARKEQQRKLDLHVQALLQEQKAIRKKRSHTPRPHWISECSNIREASHLWSMSSVESNVDLPAPLTPPEPDLEPLDLYSTRSQFAEQLPLSGINLEPVHRTWPPETSKSKHLKRYSCEEGRQLKGAKVEITTNLSRKRLGMTGFDKCKALRRAKQRSRSKPIGRTLTAEQTSQNHPVDNDDAHFAVKSKDFELYERGSRMQFFQDGEDSFRPGKASSHSPSRPTGCSRKPFTTSAPESKSFLKSCKDYPSLPSKVKRLKPTQRINPHEVEELLARELVRPPSVHKVHSVRKRDSHATCSGAFIPEKPMMKARRLSPAAEQEVVNDRQAVNLQQLPNRQKNGTDETVEVILVRSSGGSSGVRSIDRESSKRNRGPPLVSPKQPSSGEDVEMDTLNLRDEKAGGCFGENGNIKDLTGDVRHQRMHLLKSLAAQLVGQVNAACSKKSELEQAAMHRSTALSIEYGSDSRLEPSPMGPGLGLLHKSKSVDTVLNTLDKPMKSMVSHPHSPAESLRDEKALDMEAAMVNKPKEYSIFHSDRLTEQEQAGCGVLAMQNENNLETTNLRSISPKAVPVSESCALPNRTTREDMCLASYPSSHSSSGSTLASSSSFVRPSSPVILPTTSKYHMDRIKYSKSLFSSTEDQTGYKRKGTWTLPVVSGTQIQETSFMPSQKSKDTSISCRDSCAHVGRDNLEVFDERHSNLGSWESNAAQLENKARCPTPNLTPLKLRLNMENREGLQGTQSEDFRSVSSKSPDNKVGIAEVPTKRGSMSGNHKITDGGRYNQAAATLQLCELNECEGNTMLSTGIANGNLSEHSGVETPKAYEGNRNLKPFQSPTSVQVRTNMFQDDQDRRKSGDTKLLIVTHLPSARRTARENLSSSSVYESADAGQCGGNLRPSVKVTYARQLHSGAMPSGACMADESVVLEMHQTNPGQVVVEMTGNSTLGNSGQHVQENLLTENLTKLQEKYTDDEAAASPVTDGRKKYEVSIFHETKEDQRICGAETSVNFANDTAITVLERSASELRCRSFDSLGSRREPAAGVPIDESRVCSSSHFSGTDSMEDLKGQEAENQTYHNLPLRAVSLPSEKTEDHCPPVSNNSNQTAIVLCDQDAVPCSMATEKTKKMARLMSHDKSLYPQIDIQNCQEWELKVRREQLEAELKRLDIQIMNSRAKLHQTPFGFQQPGRSISSCSDGVDCPNLKKSDRKLWCHVLTEREPFELQPKLLPMEERLEGNLSDHPKQTYAEQCRQFPEISRFPRAVNSNSKILAPECESASWGKEMKVAREAQMDAEFTGIGVLVDEQKGVQHCSELSTGSRHLIDQQIPSEAMKAPSGSGWCASDSGACYGTSNNAGKESVLQSCLMGNESTSKAWGVSSKIGSLGCKFKCSAQEEFLGDDQSSADISSSCHFEQSWLETSVDNQLLRLQEEGSLGMPVQRMIEQEITARTKARTQEGSVERRLERDNFTQHDIPDALQISLLEIEESVCTSDVAGVLTSSVKGSDVDETRASAPRLCPSLISESYTVAATTADDCLGKEPTIYGMNVKNTNMECLSKERVLESECPLVSPSSHPLHVMIAQENSSDAGGCGRQTGPQAPEVKVIESRHTGSIHSPFVVSGYHQKEVPQTDTVFPGSQAGSIVVEAPMKTAQIVSDTVLSSPVFTPLSKREVSKTVSQVVPDLAFTPADSLSVSASREASMITPQTSSPDFETLTKWSFVHDLSATTPQIFDEHVPTPADLRCSSSSEELSLATPPNDHDAGLTPPSLPKLYCSAGSEDESSAILKLSSENSFKLVDISCEIAIKGACADPPEAGGDDDILPTEITSDFAVAVEEVSASLSSATEIATVTKPLRNIQILTDAYETRHDLSACRPDSPSCLHDFREGERGDDVTESIAASPEYSRNEGIHVGTGSSVVRPPVPAVSRAVEIGQPPLACVGLESHSLPRSSTPPDDQESTCLAANQGSQSLGLMNCSTIASSRERYSFLPHIFGRQKVESEETGSIVSEDLENYDSDIPEDLQGDESKSQQPGEFQIISMLAPDVSVSETPAVSMSPGVLSDISSGNSGSLGIQSSLVSQPDILNTSVMLSLANQSADLSPHVQGESPIMCQRRGDVMNLSAQSTCFGAVEVTVRANVGAGDCLHVHGVADGQSSGRSTWKHQRETVVQKVDSDDGEKQREGSTSKQVLQNTASSSSESAAYGNDSTQKAVVIEETIYNNPRNAISSSQDDAPDVVARRCSLPEIRGALKNIQVAKSGKVSFVETYDSMQQALRQSDEIGDALLHQNYESCSSIDSSRSEKHTTSRWPAPRPLEAPSSEPLGGVQCSGMSLARTSHTCNLNMEETHHQDTNLEVSLKSNSQLKCDISNEDELSAKTSASSVQATMLTTNKMLIPELSRPVSLGAGNGKRPDLRLLAPLNPIGILSAGHTKRVEEQNSIFSFDSREKVIDDKFIDAGKKMRKETFRSEPTGSLSQMKIDEMSRDEKIKGSILNSKDGRTMQSISESPRHGDLRLTEIFYRKEGITIMSDAAGSSGKPEPARGFASTSDEGSAESVPWPWLKTQHTNRSSLQSSTSTDVPSNGVSSRPPVSGDTEYLGKPDCSEFSGMFSEGPDQIIETRLYNHHGTQVGASRSAPEVCFTSDSGNDEHCQARGEVLKGPFCFEYGGDVKVEKHLKFSSTNAPEVKGLSSSFSQEDLVTKLDVKFDVSMRDVSPDSLRLDANDSSTKASTLFCTMDSQVRNVEVDPMRQARRAEFVDVLTDILYEDLFAAELPGLLCGRAGGEGILSPKYKFEQKGQVMSVPTPTTCPLGSKSRKSSNLLVLLKHFLPTGWRCVSTRQKNSLFLRESYHWHRVFQKLSQGNGSSRTPPLDFDSIFVRVQTTFQELGLDENLQAGYNNSSNTAAMNLRGNTKDNHIWKALMSDLVHELLQEHVENKSMFSLRGGIQKGCPPVCTEKLVHLVTSRILEHERLASLYRFDVEKTIAQTFKDDHWEWCWTEGDHIVGELVGAILHDLLEDFIREVCSAVRENC